MFFAFCILIVALLSTTADARTLEDVLRDKGVISEADYREIEKSRPVSYKTGEGFTFLSPDEKFKLNIGGVLQLRYTLLDVDDRNDTDTKKAQDFSRFELRRVKVHFSGYAFSEDLTYKLRINPANLQDSKTVNGGILEETYIDYRIRDEVQFRFGQDKLPFGRQFQTSTAQLQFPELSVVSLAFVPGYDTGLTIHGKVADGLLSYNIGGYGGVGQNTFRTTTDNAFNARISTDPLGEMKLSESDVEMSKKPLLSLGANYFRDTLNPGSTLGRESNTLYFAKTTGWFAVGSPTMPAGNRFSAAEAIDFDLVGIDGAFKWNGLSLQSEYFFARGEGQTTGVSLRGRGWYIQGGFFLVPSHLELAGRYSWIDPNRDVSGDHWVEASGAVSWYFQKHSLKLQADYTAIHKQPAVAFNAGPNATDDQQVRIQVQLMF